jgi:hypothetical protein
MSVMSYKNLNRLKANAMWVYRLKRANAAAITWTTWV